MCLRDKPAVVGVGAGGPVDLGEDLDGVAPHALEGPTQHRFGGSDGVDVRRIERRDAGIERRLHAGLGRIFVNLAAVSDPVAVRQGRDEHA